MSEMLRVENLVQQFKLDKSFLDKIKFKGGKLKYETRVVKAVNGISFTINNMFICHNISVFAYNYSRAASLFNQCIGVRVACVIISS